MTFRSIRTSALALLFLGIFASERGYCSPKGEDPLSKIDVELRMIADAPLNMCDGSVKPVLNSDGSEFAVEGVSGDILTETSKAVQDALNAAGPDPAAARTKANELLRKLEGSSRKINAKWPDTNRFHFQLLDL
jgi:hypothetical protein